MLGTFLKGTTAAAAGDIEFISSSSNGGSNLSSVTVTAPTSIQNEDVLVAFGYSTSNSVLFTPPSGFTNRATRTLTRSAFYATKLANAESGNYTFTLSNSSTAWVMIAVFRGATNATRNSGAWSASLSSNNITATGITASAQGALLGFFCNDLGSTISTAPSGMTLIASNGQNTPRLHLYGIVPNPSGGTGDKTLVITIERACAASLLQLHEV